MRLRHSHVQKHLQQLDDIAFLQLQDEKGDWNEDDEILNEAADWLEQEESKVPFKRLTKTIDVAKGLAFMCSEESGLMTGSVIDFDQTVNGWHSYSAYETNILDDSLLGE